MHILLTHYQQSVSQFNACQLNCSFCYCSSIVEWYQLQILQLAKQNSFLYTCFFPHVLFTSQQESASKVYLCATKSRDFPWTRRTHSEHSQEEHWRGQALSCLEVASLSVAVALLYNTETAFLYSVTCLLSTQTVSNKSKKHKRY